MEKLLSTIKSIEAFQKLKSLGGEIYLVGGCVRDFYLGKESKDIDIIVRLLTDKVITETLALYGRVDKVGESFGVIKFSPKGWEGEPFDIALPRMDKLVDKTKGHHGIEVEFDPFLSIEADLERRDHTCNSIAISWDGEVIDPFFGLFDIEHKIIRATSPKSFQDDPLRLLRAIQFASRFGFKIEPVTWRMIQDSKADIKTISGERILEELEKIYEKGDIELGINLLIESGLHYEIFSDRGLNSVQNINTRGDFYYRLCGLSTRYLRCLRGEIKVAKEIDAINYCFSVNSSLFEKRKRFFEAIQISNLILKSGAIPKWLNNIQREFLFGKYPKTLKELAVNGDDLLALGYKGIEIGNKLKELLYLVLADKVLNTKEELLKNI